MQLVTAHHSESDGLGLDPHEKNWFACMTSGEHRELFATRPLKLYFTRFKDAGHGKWYYFHHALLPCLTICKSLLFYANCNQIPSNQNKYASRQLGSRDWFIESMFGILIFGWVCKNIYLSGSSVDPSTPLPNLSTNAMVAECRQYPTATILVPLCK